MRDEVSRGTAQSGGTNNSGTIFEFVPATSALNTIINFNSTNGATPLSELTYDKSRNLYGTTFAVIDIVISVRPW